MPPKKNHLKIVKVPLDYTPEDIAPKFPPMPILYLELLENKQKVKPELKNKEYIPKSLNTNMENIKLSNVEKSEATVDIHFEDTNEQKSSSDTEKKGDKKYNIIDFTDYEKKREENVNAIGEKQYTDFKNDMKRQDEEERERERREINRERRDSGRKEEREKNKDRESKRREESHKDRHRDRDRDREESHKDRHRDRDRDREKRKDAERESKHRESRRHRDRDRRDRESKHRDRESRHQEESRRHRDRDGRDRGSKRESRHREESRKRESRDKETEKTGTSKRLEELLRGETKEEVKPSESSSSSTQSSQSTQSSNNSGDKNVKFSTIPPLLSHIEKGEVSNHQVKGGTVNLKDITYQSTNDDIEMNKKRELLFRFDILRRSYKGAVIPEYSEYTELSTMQKSYEDTVRRLSLDASVDNYKKYLIGGFMGVEFILGNWFKFDMNGFAKEQIIAMNSYERLLIELGEKSYLTQQTNLPVEFRLILLIIFNAAVFIVTKMIFKSTGTNFMGMMNFQPDQTQSSSAPVPPKKKMKGPDINISDLK
jgi:hypothetical protein